MLTFSTRLFKYGGLLEAGKLRKLHKLSAPYLAYYYSMKVMKFYIFYTPNKPAQKIMKKITKIADQWIYDILADENWILEWK